MLFPTYRTSLIAGVAFVTPGRLAGPARFGFWVLGLPGLGSMTPLSRRSTAAGPLAPTTPAPTEKPPPSFLSMLLEAAKDPMIVILLIVAIVSCARTAALP